MTRQLVLFLAAVMSTAVVCLTVTRAGIFAPVRGALARHSRFLGELSSCPFCLSFWTAAPAAIMLHRQIALHPIALVNYLLLWLCTVALAPIPTYWIFRCYTGIGVAEPEVNEEDLDEEEGEESR